MRAEKTGVRREAVGVNGEAKTPDAPDAPEIGFFEECRPERLFEPELSAFRAVHARIVAAEAERVQAEREWRLLQPILSYHYRIGEGDKIDGEGRILRAVPESGGDNEAEL